MHLVYLYDVNIFPGVNPNERKSSRNSSHALIYSESLDALEKKPKTHLAFFYGVNIFSRVNGCIS